MKVEYKYTVPTTENQISSVLNNFAIASLVPTNIKGMFILFANSRTQTLVRASLQTNITAPTCCVIIATRCWYNYSQICDSNASNIALVDAETSTIIDTQQVYNVFNLRSSIVCDDLENIQPGGKVDISYSKQTSPQRQTMTNFLLINHFDLVSQDFFNIFKS